MATDATSLDSVLVPIRESYVPWFQSKLDQLRADGSLVSSETIQRDVGNEVMRPNVLNLPVRTDAVIRTQTGLERAVFAPATALEANALYTGSAYPLDISINACAWDSVEVRFDMLGGITDLKRLRRWYLEWFQSRRIAALPDLAGAVHRMTGPHKAGTGWQLLIDMGTAPVTAATDLVEALAESGVRKLEIGASPDRERAEN